MKIFTNLCTARILVIVGFLAGWNRKPIFRCYSSGNTVNSRMNETLRIACGILAAALMASDVYGHHASNLDYDADRIGTIEGVVDDIFWANPHIHLYLTVSTDDGTTETWDMEGPNLTSMRRRGVERDVIAIGDTVRVTGTLGRDGARRIWAQTIVRQDGTVIMGDGR